MLHCTMAGQPPVRRISYAAVSGIPVDMLRITGLPLARRTGISTTCSSRSDSDFQRPGLDRAGETLDRIQARRFTQAGFFLPVNWHATSQNGGDCSSAGGPCSLVDGGFSDPVGVIATIRKQHRSRLQSTANDVRRELRSELMYTRTPP